MARVRLCSFYSGCHRWPSCAEECYGLTYVFNHTSELKDHREARVKAGRLLQHLRGDGGWDQSGANGGW